jgi:GH15 family glucan-1,4-alpha-glucosidase
MPSFDSDACFAALLGNDENGRFKIAPLGDVLRVSRRYRDDTLILETRLETAEGVVDLVDLMPLRGAAADVVRVVVGVSGSVRMRMELVIRFGYGAVVPWVQARDHGIEAVAGPDLLQLSSPVPTHGENYKTIAEFTVAAGERIPFVLTWSPSHLSRDKAVDPELAIADTERFWREWSARCTYQGPYASAVRRSLLTLKALTYAPTGGIAAAATTSLPEQIGGVRNWDYRYCWIRDATFTLYALTSAGYVDEARAWRDWLLRAVAGDPAQIRIMYGLAGERRLLESELQLLGGYEGSRPVRNGNCLL